MMGSKFVFPICILPRPPSYNFASMPGSMAFNPFALSDSENQLKQAAVPYMP
jgi:hypothetical protein